MLTTTGQLLRERTADVHHRLETARDLTAPDTDADGLLDVLALRSFTPYDEGPQPMWRAYQRVLEAWTDGNELRIERVAAAALHCFTALAEWTAPLARAAAA